MQLNRLRVLPVAAVLAGLSSAVFAATPVVISNISNLQPNTAGQQIQFFISGADQIAGENINVQVNDGNSGPLLTGIDIISGTIFASNNTNQNGQGIVTNSTNPSLDNHLAIVSTTTNPGTGTVVDNGLLLTLTVSTIGAPSNTFTLNLLNTVNLSSNLILPNASTILFNQPNIHFSIGSVDRQWNVNGGGVWSADANWTPFAPYAAGDAADFYGALTTATTAIITVDGTRTVGAVNFNNAVGSYDLVPQSATVGAIVLNNNGAAPMINDSAGSHTIAAPITLTANTNVTVVRTGDAVTISGNISGSGDNLQFSGLGTVILTGANAYAGTTINSGATVQIGNGLATGSLGTGAVTDNGTLAFDLSNVSSIANAISGSGGLSVFGNGTVDLTSAAHYSGQTAVSAGLLDFGGNATHTIGPLSISSAGSLAVDAGTKVVSNALNINTSGSWTIAGTLQIQQGLANAGTSVMTSVPTFSGTGQLDITDNKLIFESTGATGNKTTMLSSLFSMADAANIASGPWTNAAEITSSTVAADQLSLNARATTFRTTLAVFDNGAPIPALQKTSFGGQPVDPNSILVTRALQGDGNLDGVVNNADFVVISNHFGLTGQTWATGDYNGDGVVNNADFVIMSNDFGQSIPGASFNLSPGGSSGGLGSTGAVPEPGSLAVMLLGASLCLYRRRREAQPILRHCVPQQGDG